MLTTQTTDNSLHYKTTNHVINCKVYTTMDVRIRFKQAHRHLYKILRRIAMKLAWKKRHHLMSVKLPAQPMPVTKDILLRDSNIIRHTRLPVFYS